MSKGLITQTCIMGYEAGQLVEVARAIEKDQSNKTLRRLINELSNEPRKCTRTLPVKEMRTSNDFDSRIGGTAIIYNSPSQKLAGNFIEYIRPGCFSKSLNGGSDVLCFFNHNGDLVLGRTSSGTLKLTDEHRGISFVCDLPNTQAGRDTYELVKRRDIIGMSFAFMVNKSGDRWTTLPNGEAKRELIDCELREVSPCADPAYPLPDVGVRKLIDRIINRNHEYDTWVRRERLRLKEIMMSNNPEYKDYDLSARERKLSLFEKL